MRRFFARFANLLLSGRAEREMTREMESHLALLREDLERRGLSPEDAARAARRAYGGVEQARELHRDTRSFVWMEQFCKDFRYAWRNLLRNPGFTAVAALALALGIGANATIFGIYNAVALKQLPVADPARVVRVTRWNRYFSSDNFTDAEYRYLRDHNTVLSGLTAASLPIPVLASINGAPERRNAIAVSTDYFLTLGVPAALGRGFVADEDRTPVVVLSWTFWQRSLHADPNVCGRGIRLNTTIYTIVGVAPRNFTGTGSMPSEAAFWVPLSMMDRLTSFVPSLELLARLKNGVSRTGAQAQIDPLLRGYLAGYRETVPTTAVTLRRTAWFGSADNPWFQAFAAAVLIVVSMVLLAACANVANMLLARGTARQREIAIRLALGGSRARVIRQLLAESVLLSLLGGAAGVFLSLWASRILWTAIMSMFHSLRGFQFDLDLTPDGHVFVYGVILSVLTGVAFGLLPALRSTRSDLHAAAHRDRPSRLRGVLLAAQVMVSVLLLVVSGGLMSGLARSFVTSGELGFQPENTYSIRVATPKDAAGTMQRLRERFEKLPELSHATLGGAPMAQVLSLPLSVAAWHGQSSTSFAADGYFETLGVRMVRGRGFTRQEALGGAPVAVISESTARRLWPHQDALGEHLTVGLAFLKSTSYQVIGIAGDTRFAFLTQPDPLHLYLPTGSLPRPLYGIIARIHGNRDQALAAIESAVESFDPSLLPGLEMVSLEDGPIAAQRTFFRVLAVFAGVLTLLALALSAIGIYGVMAFLVSQRTREIGIRIALGASSPLILRGVIVQGLRPVLIGGAVGLVAALRVIAYARVAAAQQLNLFTRTFTDPALYGELTLVLAIAILASVIPARRALSVDPVEALRHE